MTRTQWSPPCSVLTGSPLSERLLGSGICIGGAQKACEQQQCFGRGRKRIEDAGACRRQAGRVQAPRGLVYRSVPTGAWDSRAVPGRGYSAAIASGRASLVSRTYRGSVSTDALRSIVTGTSVLSHRAHRQWECFRRSSSWVAVGEKEVISTWRRMRPVSRSVCLSSGQAILSCTPQGGAGGAGPLVVDWCALPSGSVGARTPLRRRGCVVATWGLQVLA